MQSADNQGSSSQDQQQPPRPSNRFMLFRADFSKRYKRGLPENVDREMLQVGYISRLAGQEWGAMSREARARWEQKAKEAKMAHDQLYPNYIYKPQRKPRKTRPRNGDEEEDQDLLSTQGPRRQQRSTTTKTTPYSRRRHHLVKDVDLSYPSPSSSATSPSPGPYGLYDSVNYFEGLATAGPSRSHPTGTKNHEGSIGPYQLSHVAQEYSRNRGGAYYNRWTGVSAPNAIQGFDATHRAGSPHSVAFQSPSNHNLRPPVTASWGNRQGYFDGAIQQNASNTARATNRDDWLYQLQGNSQWPHARPQWDEGRRHHQPALEGVYQHQHSQQLPRMPDSNTSYSPAVSTRTYQLTIDRRAIKPTPAPAASISLDCDSTSYNGFNGNLPPPLNDFDFKINLRQASVPTNDFADSSLAGALGAPGQAESYYAVDTTPATDNSFPEMPVVAHEDQLRKIGEHIEGTSTGVPPSTSDPLDYDFGDLATWAPSDAVSLDPTLLDTNIGGFPNFFPAYSRQEEDYEFSRGVEKSEEGEGQW